MKAEFKEIQINRNGSSYVNSPVLVISVEPEEFQLYDALGPMFVPMRIAYIEGEELLKSIKKMIDETPELQSWWEVYRPIVRVKENGFEKDYALDYYQWGFLRGY